MGEKREETGPEWSVPVPRQFTALGANAAKALRFRVCPEVGGRTSFWKLMAEERPPRMKRLRDYASGGDDLMLEPNSGAPLIKKERLFSVE
jgi:hypothetical protein